MCDICKLDLNWGEVQKEMGQEKKVGITSLIPGRNNGEPGPSALSQSRCRVTRSRNRFQASDGSSSCFSSFSFFYDLSITFKLFLPQKRLLIIS